MDTKWLHESEAGSVGLAPLDVNKDTPLLDSLCVHVLFIIARHQHQNTHTLTCIYFSVVYNTHMHKYLHSQHSDPYIIKQKGTKNLLFFLLPTELF